MQTRFEVEGMTCGGCASKVTSALQKDPRVLSAVIDFATRTGVVTGDIESPEIQRIVQDTGYKVVSNAAESSGARSVTRSDITHEEVLLIIGALLVSPVMILAMGPWDFENSGLWQAFLTTVFMVGPASGFFKRSWTQLRHGYVSMDALIAIGMSSAWIISVAMLKAGSHHLFFESAAMIGFFVMTGKALEDRARRRSIGDVDRLVKLRPRKAFKVMASGQLESVQISDIHMGDQVYLRPGDMLALDGVIAEGEGSFDESIISGESAPMLRKIGDPVPSGAVNAGASGIKVKITRVGQDTTIEQIIKLMEDARLARPPIQKLADKIAGIFVPIVMAIALMTTIGWWASGQRNFSEALMIGLSVLVVACPCALGLATPVAWVAGLGRAARQGILIRSYDALETLRRANVIIFDKTGTLTFGEPDVTVVTAANGRTLSDCGDSAEQIEHDVMLLFSALTHSSHPQARALARWIKLHYDTTKAPLSKLIEEVAGQGVRCEVMADKNYIVLFGRANFVLKKDHIQWQQQLAGERSTVAVSIDDAPAFLFELSDKLRPDVSQAFKKIQSLHIDSYIASGDKEAVVSSLVTHLEQTGMSRGKIIAQGGMTPVTKKSLVDSLRAKGKIVAFVGDGINDAPAIAAADVGIAMGSGSDVAASSAGLVIQRAGLSTLVEAVELSVRVTRVIRENFFWAFFYNIAAIPVAVAGHVTPMWAAAAMAFSSVSVVLNALRLTR